MGEHYSQQAPRTGYRRATAYTPPYADYNGYHPEISYGHTSSGRGPDVTEIMTLRSRISVLERQLVERHREIGDARRETGEARAAIAYLLKLNASATSSHGSVSGCRPENHPSNGQAAIVMEQVKDLLSTMISLVHKQLSIAVNNNHRSGHLPRAKDKSGDSALHDQCPTIETRNAGKKTWPQQGDCNVPEALPGLQSEKPSEHGETQDIPEPTPTAPEKGETSKSDDFPLLPYVTRFTQAEGQAPQLASDRHNDKAVSTPCLSCRLS